MSPPSRAALTALCSRRLKQYLRKNPDCQLPLPLDHAEAELGEITHTNLLLKRLERLNERRTPGEKLTVAKYADRVIRYWFSEYRHWQPLQDKNSAAWTPLYQELFKTARNHLAHRPIPFAPTFSAEDFAQVACYHIGRGRFPFDVEFMVWARTVLKNVMREPNRSKDVLDYPHDWLDAPHPTSATQDPAEFYWELPDSKVQHSFQAIADLDEIQAVWAQLAPARQRVFVLTFLQDLDDAAIAKQMSISKNAVHSLRHRTLQQMAQILEGKAVQVKHRRRRSSK